MKPLNELKQLRSKLNDKDSKILDLIWQEYMVSGEWPVTSLIEAKMKSPKAVKHAVKRMGKAVISHTPVRGKQAYYLTMLGLLLSPKGEDILSLLALFLDHLRDLVDKNMSPDFRVSRKNLIQDVGICQEDILTLRRIDDACGHLWGAFQGEDTVFFFQAWDGVVNLLDAPEGSSKYLVVSEALSLLDREEERLKLLNSLEVDFESEHGLYKDRLRRLSTDGEKPVSSIKSEEDSSWTNYSYDVAVSFAGEQRKYVEQVVECLKAKDISCFYDKDPESEIEMWGKNLTEHFQYIFFHAARYCVMFISSDYAKKKWTRLERRYALERAMEQEEEYVLPVRFDETELPGLPKAMKYINCQDCSPYDLADKIESKLSMLPPETMFIEDTKGALNVQEHDWLCEISAILVTLKLYISEIKNRNVNPGLEQICQTFESACDDLRKHLKQPYCRGLHNELRELSAIAEEVATFDFYIGKDCWQEFISKLSIGEEKIIHVLSDSTILMASNIRDTHEIKDLFSNIVSDLKAAQHAISTLGDQGFKKRIFHYQTMISEAGMRMYRLAWVLELNGKSHLAEVLRDEAVWLHLIEAVDPISDAWSLLDKMNKLPERLERLQKLRIDDYGKGSDY